MTIKSIIIKYLIVALLAFVLGTFFPNPVAKKKTQGETVAWAKQLGFGPPRFEYSNDNGKTWFSHNNGKWYNTSASFSDGVNTERTVTIDPPMTGNAFKILVDHHNNHITGRSTVARFDFLVDISPDYKPVEGIKEMPKRAMMDLKAKFSASSVWDSAWNNPRLDSKSAIWSAKDQNLDDQWW